MPKRKKQSRRPNLPATTNLRPRLDRLFHAAADPDADDAVLLSRLDTINQGVSADNLIPILLTARLHAPASVHTRLDAVLTDWLQRREALSRLEHLVRTGALDDEQQIQALTWLEATGYDVGATRAELAQSSFYRAFMHANRMQGTVTVFFYSDRKRTRVEALGFLLDYQPPWEGAIKDVTHYTRRPPEQAVTAFLDFWQNGMRMPPGEQMQEISDQEAKTVLLQALHQNRALSIRLHKDFGPIRDRFLRHILTLPDGPETPRLTVEELDALQTQGTSSESLQANEQTSGYRIRLEDGQEIRMLRPPDDE